MWISYIQYINILKQFILAERTSNWHFHLQSLKRILNLFAASGHLNYAKSARLYLQKMLFLQTSHPWLFEKFVNGFHAVRRTDHHWSGLWSDLVIEQTMMRSIKTRSGLTRGMEDSVRNLWVLSMHSTSAVHNAMM